MELTGQLDDALEAWEYTREGLIREVENLSEADLAFRPHPGSRTTNELVVHVIEAGLMMSGELSRPDGDFRRQAFPAFIKEYAGDLILPSGKRELVALLKRTHADGDQRLRAAGEPHMRQLITRFDGKRGTRIAWMHHGISHEEYHRGQLALYARLAGHVPALTQLIYDAISRSADL